MKKYILIFFIFQISYSQSELNLPNSDYEIDYKSLTPISNIYIYKNGEIFLENENIKILDLGKTLFEIKNKFPIEDQWSIQVHLLADKSTDFRIIDSVKTELSSARLNLYYRTNHLDDFTKGINWRNHSSLYYFELPEENTEFNENDIEIDIEFIQSPIEIQINDELYKQNFEKARNLLSSIKYSNIRYFDKDYLKINDFKINIKDYPKILETISDYDVLFIRFQNKMSYNEYINLITTIKNVYKIFREKENREVPFFEISYDLESILQENNFEL